MKKAILLMTFTRLDTLKAVFEQIRIAKPPRLYVASDGPRESKEGEKEIVEAVRNWILNNIDWDCEVKTLFREKNLGCGSAVASAISWFFENETDGIILEDDCVPCQSFFYYCEELLNYYKEDKRIWHIAGDNPLGTWDNGASYYFAKIQHCWGWATWADRWKNHQLDLKDYDEKNIRKFSKDKWVQKFWERDLDYTQKNKGHSWDSQWVFKIVENNGICINPSKNLISNIGDQGEHFDENTDKSRLNRKVYELEKIVHPEKIEVDEQAVDLIYKKAYGIRKPTIIDFFKYVKIYPLFLFRKDFWQRFV